MSTNTSKGITYPEETDSTRLWEHFQTMANSINGVILGTPDVQVFETSGTWSKPAGAIWVVVEVQGGGGGAGGVARGTTTTAAEAPGAGGGEYAKGTYAASDIGSTESVVVGRGGTGGAIGNNAGGDGGTSSFGSHITAVGGLHSPGAAAVNGTVSVGGANGGSGGTGGDFRMSGGGGGASTIVGTVPIKTNMGGNSFYASVTRSTGTSNTDSNGFDGNTYGGGANGASSGIGGTVGGGGGDGGDGVVIVTTYKA